MKRSIYTITAAVALTLAMSEPAAAGLYEDFFQASGENAEERVRSNSRPQVHTSNDLDGDARRLMEDGYLFLGTASWVGRPEGIKETEKFANKIKASVALVKYRFVETVSGGTRVMMMPVIGGYGGMIGGAQPVSFDRYEQTAYFFAKLKPEKIGIGIRYQPLTLSQVQTIGSAKGIAVTIVVRGSPAFDAGIIAGDVILTVAGQDVSTSDRLNRIKAEYASQEVLIEIIRGGQTQTLGMTMPAVATAQDKK